MNNQELSGMPEIASKENTGAPAHNIKGTNTVCRGTGKVPELHQEDGNPNIRRCLYFKDCMTKFSWRPNRSTLGGRWTKTTK